MNKKYILTKACNSIAVYCENNLNKLEVKPLQGVFNQKCHQNAVNFALNESHNVYEVMLVNKIDNDCILHYINEREGVFYETTLGHFHKKYDYFLIRKIDENDYMNIVDVFVEQLEKWNKKFVGFYGRFILGISRCV